MTRVLAVVLLLACAGTTPVETPAPHDNLTRWWNGVQRAPTTMHVYIYEMMQECVGIEGEPFETIQWISVDFLLRADYQRLGGLWIGNGRIILLAHQRFNDPVVVSEELLHALLPMGEYDDPHDDPRFQRCLIKQYVAHP